MASETGESTSSFDMLTPTISVSETPGHANATEQPLDDELLPLIPDDLRRGRHLWQRAVQEHFDRPHGSGMNLSWLSIPHQETLPDDTGTRLHSEICTVSLGPTEVVLKAHQDVLSQSPVFAALLKYQSLSRQALQIELPDQDPAVVRRVLQYMYGQKLPLAASESNERVEELIEGYILACRLELDVLQDLILKALSKHDIGTGRNTILFAAGKVYKADQARTFFRQLFMTTLKKGIEEEGFAGPDNLGGAVKELVASGGTIAKDIAEVFQQIHEQGKGDKSGEAKLKVQMLSAHDKNAELEAQINGVRAEKASADARTAELERVLVLTQKETESHSKAAEAKTEAAEKDLEALKKTVRNKKTKSKLKLEQEAADQADYESKDPDFAGDDEYEAEDRHSLGQQESESEYGESNEEQEHSSEDDGLVAIACKDYSPKIRDELHLERGDMITNIQFVVNRAADGELLCLWLGYCNGHRGRFSLDCVQNSAWFGEIPCDTRTCY